MNNYDLWEAIPVACLLTSKTGLISDINPSAEILFNVSKKKVLKKTINSILESDIDFLRHFSDLGKGSNTLKFKSSIIFDGRNQYIAYDLENKGFEYYRIGK